MSKTEKEKKRRIILDCYKYYDNYKKYGHGVCQLILSFFMRISIFVLCEISKILRKDITIKSRDE